MVVDLNKTLHKALIANAAINERLDAAIMKKAEREPQREYLGASSIGHECLRRIQWDWRKPKIPNAKSQRVFWRGHTWEDYTAKLFVQGGFDLRRGGPETGFEQADGRFRGHCDGVFYKGPEIEGVGYPCLWEAKALGETSYRAIERDGLKKAKPEYYAQVQLYMAYLGLMDHPAIFTVNDVSKGQILHMLVPFSPEAAQEASDRAVTVLRADEHGETLPRVSDDPAFWLCKMCGHKVECFPDA